MTWKQLVSNTFEHPAILAEEGNPRSRYRRKSALLHVRGKYMQDFMVTSASRKQVNCQQKGIYCVSISSKTRKRIIRGLL